MTRRHPELPDVAPMPMVPGYESAAWGMFITPTGHRRRSSTDCRRARRITDPAMRERLTALITSNGRAPSSSPSPPNSALGKAVKASGATMS
jgi:hypothetical protein